MSLILRIACAAILALAIAAATAWAALALWYRLPAEEWARGAAAVLFALLGLATIVALFGRSRLRAGLAFVGAFIASWLLPRLGIGLGSGLIRAIINATIGAALLLTIIRLARA